MITKILVATDGSECAIGAATYAATLAQQFGAQVTLLHVVEVPRVPLSLDAFSEDQRERVRRELLDAGRAILAMTEKPFTKIGIPTEVELMEGRAPEVIVEVATRAGHDLIVVGSRGLNAAARLLLGSVSERVAHAAPCPVLIVRKGVVPACH